MVANESPEIFWTNIEYRLIKSNQFDLDYKPIFIFLQGLNG